MQLTVNPSISVTGAPGIYCFDPVSGTGKSLLFQLLLNTRPDSVVLVTYTDSMHVNFVGKAPKFVLCDRADMYRESPEFQELLNKYKESCVVCVDLKKQEGVSGDAYATIAVAPDMGIEVDCVCL